MLKMFFINFAPGCSTPSELLEKLNREYCGVIQTGEYVTAFYMVFDPKKEQVSYCGAGHPSVTSMAGGMNDWAAAGYPTTTGN